VDFLVAKKPFLLITIQVLLRALTLWFMLLALAVPEAARAQEVPDLASVRRDYAQLLALFPEDRQGYGKDAFRGYTGDQPMTLGLVVSAEAIHYLHMPNDESRRRVRTGVRWLLDHRDLDHDGAPGWGLPQPWDTFADGTENPANHSYTITTAIVMNGLLDALRASDLWSSAEKTEIRDMLVSVSRRWCRELWSEGYGGGYFWYSPREEDSTFCVNSPSMFLGSLTRLLAEQGEALTDEDRKLFTERRDAQAKAIVSTVELRDGAPFWKYTPLPNRYNKLSPNDLVHQVYTLWGIETYRDAQGPVAITWTRADAVRSVDQFWRAGAPAEFSQDSGPLSVKQPARLWCAGMMLAFYAHWGSAKQAEDCFLAIHDRYGPWPRMQLRPVADSADTSFYPRHAAHVLYGLSLECYQSKLSREEK
jgi:hypothetical protein